MAKLANDINLKQIYLDGLDVYKANAALFNEKDIKDVTKGERQDSKAFVLGYIYGLSFPKARRNAKIMYGRSISLEKSKEYRDKFFAKYNNVQRYHKWQSQKVEKEKELRTLANRPVFGDIRYTQAINLPDQGSGADIIKTAIGLIYYELKELGYTPCTNTDIRLVNVIHDEQILEATIDKAELAKDILERNMQIAFKRYVPDIPINTDALIGKNLAEVKD